MWPHQDKNIPSFLPSLWPVSEENLVLCSDVGQFLWSF
ncbi:hypothetical protein COOONC_16051 [Cooperia oncophora]